MCERALPRNWGSWHALEDQLTESNFFVESSATGGLLGHDLLGREENAVLLLEGSFILDVSHLRSLLSGK